MELNSYTFMHRSRRLPNASVALMLVSCRNRGCNRSITKHFYPDTTSDFTVVLKKATLMSHSHTFDKQRLVSHACVLKFVAMFLIYQIGRNIMNITKNTILPAFSDISYRIYQKSS